MIIQARPTKLIEISQTERKISSQTKNSSVYKNFGLNLNSNVNQLSATRYERHLSPWTRKKDEEVDKKNQGHGQTVTSIGHILQKSNNITNKTPIAALNETKMNDFLRKIQFTKKKKNLNQGRYQTNKSTKSVEKEIFDQIDLNKEVSCNIMDFGEQEIKKLIIYPKVQKIVESIEKKNNKFQLKTNQKQLSTKKMASIQNFYDPYQNKSKVDRKLLHDKGMDKYHNKLDEILLNKTVSIDNPSSFNQLSQTWRKNSTQQKLHRRNYSMPENQSLNKQTFSGTFKGNSHNTFFNSRTNTVSHNHVTERQAFIDQNPQAHANKSQSQYVQFQPTYATPACQAIKRIKQQHKKSKRMKTQGNHQKQTLASRQSNILTPLQTRNENYYLYQTFLNYKNQKDSNDINITKTLGFNFHNKESFRQKIEKTWLKTQHE